METAKIIIAQQLLNAAMGTFKEGWQAQHGAETACPYQFTTNPGNGRPGGTGPNIRTDFMPKEHAFALASILQETAKLPAEFCWKGEGGKAQCFIMIENASLAGIEQGKIPAGIADALPELNKMAETLFPTQPTEPAKKKRFWNRAKKPTNG